MIGTLLKWMIAICLSNAVLPANGLAQEQDRLSPRAFCRTTGGTISESGSPHIFICCYDSKRKCVLNNELRRYSREVSLAPEEQAVQMVRESSGGAWVE